MIISFTVENWMSFRSPATLSMVASRERQHGERVPKVKKYQTRLLPIVSIYGGNASGKTAFFKALNFMKKMVVRGTQPDGMIAIEPFRLDTTSTEKPSRFKIEILVNEIIYEFSFAVTRKSVVEEKLVQITSAAEKTLYDRQGDQPNLDDSLENQKFLNFAFQGTRGNQLFLTNSVSQKVDAFRPVYDWFKETLELIAPDARFGGFEDFLDEGHSLRKKMDQILPMLDTGISHLGSEEITFDNLPFPDELKDKLQEEFEEGASIQLINPSSSERIVLTIKEGVMTARKLVTYHQKSDGTELKFNMQQESDGSIRIIDLLPVILEISLTTSRKVFVIDEIDRSLHTLLIRQILETYLTNCSNESRSQLLFTTHDVLLMDQKLLRRDEMWVTERDAGGNSSLTSFSDFEDIRYDKDIRKSYLQGRLGGVPRILLNRCITSHKEAD